MVGVGDPEHLPGGASGSGPHQIEFSLIIELLESIRLESSANGIGSPEAGLGQLRVCGTELVLIPTAVVGADALHVSTAEPASQTVPVG